MTHCTQVLRVNEVEETAAYRAAVANILRQIQVDEETTLLEISEKIGVSLGTVSNAANKKATLSPMYLGRLGKAYGTEHLNPYAALFGGRFIPLETRDVVDLLPLLTEAANMIAVARSRGETHRDRAAYLPVLRHVRHEVGAQVAILEKELAA